VSCLAEGVPPVALAQPITLGGDIERSLGPRADELIQGPGAGRVACHAFLPGIDRAMHVIYSRNQGTPAIQVR
jgi:hypothetical protein